MPLGTLLETRQIDEFPLCSFRKDVSFDMYIELLGHLLNLTLARTWNGLGVGGEAPGNLLAHAIFLRYRADFFAWLTFQPLSTKNARRKKCGL